MYIFSCQFTEDCAPTFVSPYLVFRLYSTRLLCAVFHLLSTWHILKRDTDPVFTGDWQ